MPEIETKPIRRRLPALLAALSIAAAGLAWAGCGGSDETTSGGEAQERIERGIEEAKKGIDKGKEEAKKGLEKGKKEAEKGLKQGKSEAQKGIEEAEQRIQENVP